MTDTRARDALAAALHQHDVLSECEGPGIDAADCIACIEEADAILLFPTKPQRRALAAAFLGPDTVARWHDAMIAANCPDPDKYPEDAEAFLSVLDDLAALRETP